MSETVLGAYWDRRLKREAAEKRKRIGRPTKTPAPHTRAQLSMIVTAKTKNRIDADARASGRTQSQEAERRIELSYVYERLFRLMERRNKEPTS